MDLKKRSRKALMVLLLVALAAVLAGCTSAATTSINSTATTGPGGGTVVRNDSIVKAQIKSIGPTGGDGMTTVDVFIISSDSVDDIVNETADKLNTVITVRTDEDMSSYAVDEYITAHIQLAGDVEHGTFLYMHDVGPAK